MKITEAEIQGLKSQEAKDLAVELLQKLEAKTKAPISAGEVQLKELQYELKLKEAEAQDSRQRETHEQRIKELELQIEQEKARQSEAESRASAIREEHAKLVEKVQTAEESLSIQLERFTRENNLKIETLDSEFAARADQLRKQREEMEQRRDQLLDEINGLAELSESAGAIANLREQIESRRNASQQEFQQLDEEFASAQFEKTKKLNEIRRQQELAITELETEHKKNVLQVNRKAAEEILANLGMVALEKAEWEQRQVDLQGTERRGEQELADIREQAKQEVLKAYNITSAEALDVTDLYYRHQALSREAESLRGQVDKLDTELRRMQQHIEQEPQRIATAVEAAKVHIQNNIEQGSKR